MIALETMEATLTLARQTVAQTTAALMRLSVVSGSELTRQILATRQAEAQQQVVCLEAALARLTPPPIPIPDTAEAWSLVLQYSREIDNIFRKFNRAEHPDREDRRQDYIERIVTRYPQFAAYCQRNPVQNKRALVLNWLQTQAKASRNAGLKKVRWREVLEVAPDPRGSRLELRLVQPETPETVLAQRGMEAQLHQLVAAASPAEQEALLEVLEELPKSQRELTPKQLALHLDALRRRVRAHAA